MAIRLLRGAGVLDTGKRVRPICTYQSVTGIEISIQVGLRLKLSFDASQGGTKWREAVSMAWICPRQLGAGESRERWRAGYRFGVVNRGHGDSASKRIAKACASCLTSFSVASISVSLGNRRSCLCRFKSKKTSEPLGSLYRGSRVIVQRPAASAKISFPVPPTTVRPGPWRGRFPNSLLPMYWMAGWPDCCSNINPMLYPKAVGGSVLLSSIARAETRDNLAKPVSSGYSRPIVDLDGWSISCIRSLPRVRVRGGSAMPGTAGANGSISGRTSGPKSTRNCSTIGGSASRFTPRRTKFIFRTVSLAIWVISFDGWCS